VASATLHASPDSSTKVFVPVADQAVQVQRFESVPSLLHTATLEQPLRASHTAMKIAARIMTAQGVTRLGVENMTNLRTS
jgi:hypothetical protein